MQQGRLEERPQGLPHRPMHRVFSTVGRGQVSASWQYVFIISLLRIGNEYLDILDVPFRVFSFLDILDFERAADSGN